MSCIALFLWSVLELRTERGYKRERIENWIFPTTYHCLRRMLDFFNDARRDEKQVLLILAYLAIISSDSVVLISWFAFPREWFVRTKQNEIAPDYWLLLSVSQQAFLDLLSFLEELGANSFQGSLPCKHPPVISNWPVVRVRWFVTASPFSHWTFSSISSTSLLRSRFLGRHSTLLPSFSGRT